MTALREIASPYVGLVRSVEERLAGTADARLPTYTAELAADERVLGAPLRSVGVLAGIGLDHDAAIDAALGEAVERYSLSYLPPGRIVRATAAELGPHAVEPCRFGLFSEQQYAHARCPFTPFAPRTRVAWIDGFAVATGEPAWLPAELVFLADVVAPGEPRIGYATSSGAACAASEREAILRGAFELLERDAFQLVWARRMSPPLLDWASDRKLVALARRAFAPTGLRYAAVDLSSVHGIPCVLGVVRAPEPEAARLGVGAGTAPTVGRAWWKALSEAFATRAAARALLAAGAPDHRADGADVRTFDDHIVFHARRPEIAGFLTASPERTDVQTIAPLARDVEGCLRAVVERVAAAGSTLYAVDVTAPDVRRLGLVVVKTVAPELCMLDVPHAWRFLGNPRLACDPNPYPHPFP